MTQTTDAMLEEVVEGLSQEQKELSPKYFYDRRGSELFEEITRLPEYYPTRTERELLEGPVAEWIVQIGVGSLVELGAGSARKTRLLLDALVTNGEAHTYAPVDVSAEFLHGVAEDLRADYPSLEIAPQVRDITERQDFAGGFPGPVVFALLGGTIGNFAEENGTRVLRNIRASMEADDFFLFGADQRPGAGKTVAELEAAYNDARGITAEFNLNMLNVLNDRLGADFDPSTFRHRAFYDEDRGRIEMHLVSLVDQVVRVPGADDVSFREGETIRTELSCKYDRAAVREMLGEADLAVAEWWTDSEDRYAVVLATPG